MVAMLAVVPAIPAFGAMPAAEHSTAVHHTAVRHSTHTVHHLTAAQRRARLARLEHERAVRRIAEEHHASRRHTTRRTTVARRTVRRRPVAHSTAAHEAYLRRVAAHRRYEQHLAHERWLREHRAYEARLEHERWLKAHPAYARRVEEQRAEQARIAREHRDAAAQVAKLDAPKATPAPVTGTVNPASLEYIPHAHIHLYWTSPLRGTHASLVRQDRRDRAEGLTRILNKSQLLAMVSDHDLIPLPLNNDIQADPHLAYDRRYTRPWTADFLRDLGRAYMHAFGEPLVITSAVRPASYQERLTFRNGNAAPANGIIASPHEFGATIDIGKKGMTAREMAWMRGYLYPLQQAGQIDVEEEFYQACFHITVYKNYVPAPVTRPQPEMADAQVNTVAR